MQFSPSELRLFGLMIFASRNGIQDQDGAVPMSWLGQHMPERTIVSLCHEHAVGQTDPAGDLNHDMGDYLWLFGSKWANKQDDIIKIDGVMFAMDDGETLDNWLAEALPGVNEIVPDGSASAQKTRRRASAKKTTEWVTQLSYTKAEAGEEIDHILTNAHLFSPRSVSAYIAHIKRRTEA